jgi:hypothetical protein
MEAGRQLAGLAIHGILVTGLERQFLPGDDGRARPRRAFYAKRERLSSWFMQMPGAMMANEQEREGLPPESKEQTVELVVGEGLPAIFVNRFYVTSNASFTRIMFAERVSGNRDLTRSILILPTSDAMALGDLLRNVIRELNGEHGPVDPKNERPST